MLIQRRLDFGGIDVCTSADYQVSAVIGEE